MNFLSKSILTTGGHIVAAALTMLAGILFARTLGPAGMGQYSLILSTVTMAAGVIGLGLGSANVFFLNSRNTPIKDIVSNAIKTTMVLGLVLAGGLTWAFMEYKDYFGRLPPVIAVAVAFGGAAYMARFILGPILVAQLMARRMVVVNLIRPLVLLLAGGLFAVIGLLNPHNTLLVLVAALVGTLCLVVHYHWQHIDLRKRFNWGLFRELGSYALKLSAASTMFALTREVSVLLLRGMRSEDFEAVGFYTRAVSICLLASIVPHAIAPWLYAKWAGTPLDQRNRQVEMAARVNVTYTLLAAAGLLLLGRPLIRLLYGAEFLPAYSALVLLAPAISLMTLFVVCQQLLASDGRAAAAAYVLTGTVIIMIAVTYLAVPGMGIQGAALGVLTGNAFAALAGMGVCWKLYRLNPLNCLFMRRQDIRYVRKALIRKT